MLIVLLLHLRRLPQITGIPVVVDEPIDDIDGIDVVIQDNDPVVVVDEEVEVEMLSKSASTQTAAAATLPSAETPPASRMASVASNNVSGVSVVAANVTNVTVDVPWTGSQYLYQNFWNARWQTGAPILVVNNYGADAWKAESRKDIDQVGAKGARGRCHAATLPRCHAATLPRCRKQRAAHALRSACCCYSATPAPPLLPPSACLRGCSSAQLLAADHPHTRPACTCTYNPGRAAEVS
jgi:hypothetical protein